MLPAIIMITSTIMKTDAAVITTMTTNTGKAAVTNLTRSDTLHFLKTCYNRRILLREEVIVHDN